MGTQELDVAAEQGTGAVQFEINELGSPTIYANATGGGYGWVYSWDTTTVPNGICIIGSIDDWPGYQYYNNVGALLQGGSGGEEVNVENLPPSTAPVGPSLDPVLESSGQVLDATAAPGVTNLHFEITGPNLSVPVVTTSTPTEFGWIAYLDTTALANGTYTLQSVASYAGGVSGTSSPVSVTVDNPPPSTTVVLPPDGTSLSGTQYLDAVASAGVTQVQYELTGGALSDDIIATATPTIYGWIAAWDTTTVPDGPYSLTSVATYAGGVTGTSPPVDITVDN